MYPSVFLPSVVCLAAIAAGSPPALPNPTDPKRFAQACSGIAEGTGCASPGEKKCCNEDLFNVIFCNEIAQIEFEHCTDGRICAPNGKGSIACFVNGEQPVPP